MMKKRILIVEDDAALARVLRDNLTFEGFDAECASDAPSGDRAFKEFSPDLVVLDIMLPGGDGFELCGFMRQRGQAAVIILTARSQKVDKLRGLASAPTTTSPSRSIWRSSWRESRSCWPGPVQASSSCRSAR
jgi:DNA-binding response OmpR family regulator